MTLPTTVSPAVRRVIGIDPGASGGIAFTLAGDPNRASAIPSGRMPPKEMLAFAMDGWDLESHRVVAYLEQVTGFIPGRPQPGSSMFKLGCSCGYWEGMLAAYNIRTILVRPQQWQKGIPGVQGLKGMDRKRALKAEACRRFPALKVTLDTCDALLIAEYGVRQERAGVIEEVLP